MLAAGQPRALFGIYCARNVLKGLHAHSRLADEVIVRDNIVYSAHAMAFAEAKAGVQI